MIRDFFKRLFGKKEIPHAVVEPVRLGQPQSSITTASSVPPVAKTPESKPKAKKPRVSKPKSSGAVHLTAWPFEEPQSSKAKDSKPKQKKVSDETAKTVAAIKTVKKSQVKKPVPVEATKPQTKSKKPRTKKNV